MRVFSEFSENCFNSLLKRLSGTKHQNHRKNMLHGSHIKDKLKKLNAKAKNQKWEYFFSSQIKKLQSKLDYI